MSLTKLKDRVVRELTEAIHKPAEDRDRWFIKAEVRDGFVYVEIECTEAEIRRHDFISGDEKLSDSEKNTRINDIDKRYEELHVILEAEILERYVCDPVFAIG